MLNHTELINFIAERIKAKTYIEIGIFDPDHNFNKINVPLKLGIDPDPNVKSNVKLESDKFFEIFKSTNGKADLYFLDGLHYADQVKRDIQNSWNCLNDGGCLVIHDCNPPTEQTTCIPRGNQREWCGTVYKAVCNLIARAFTVDFDYGVCVITKPPGYRIRWTDKDFTWQEFDNSRKELLNLVSVNEAIQIINSWE